MFWLMLIMVFNFGISWINAVYAGKVWCEISVMGVFMRLVAWSAAIMSACGFTVVFTIIVAILGHLIAPHYVTDHVMKLIYNSMYILVMFPIIGAGTLIAIHSWIEAYRDRTIFNMGLAAWNTFAMMHNVENVAQNAPSAFSSIVEAFSDDDDEVLLIVAAMVLFSVGSGIMLTRYIMGKHMYSLPLPQR